LVRVATELFSVRGLHRRTASDALRHCCYNSLHKPQQTCNWCFTVGYFLEVLGVAYEHPVFTPVACFNYDADVCQRQLTGAAGTIRTGRGGGVAAPGVETVAAELVGDQPKQSRFALLWKFSQFSVRCCSFLLTKVSKHSARAAGL